MKNFKFIGIIDIFLGVILFVYLLLRPKHPPPSSCSLLCMPVMWSSVRLDSKMDFDSQRSLWPYKTQLRNSYALAKRLRVLTFTKSSQVILLRRRSAKAHNSGTAGETLTLFHNCLNTDLVATC